MAYIYTILGFLGFCYLMGSRLSGLSIAGYGHALLLGYLLLMGAPTWGIASIFLFTILLSLVLLHPSLRTDLISRPLFHFFQKSIPPLTPTEEIALQAGKSFWEANIIAGDLKITDWLQRPVPTLSAEEKAFLENEGAALCAMIQDWDICTKEYDISEQTWAFLKEKGFFGLIIPRAYGGKGFSALLHSELVQMVAARSLTASTLVTVPNSLGPAELLVHYGTETQKDYYLPRLAKGQEIPCFGLTGPFAGSDATSIPDVGIVCKGIFEGKEIVGLKLNFDKRYITLAPIATLLGIAFTCLDPDNLLGEQTDLGITLALIPTNTAGITKGRRHYPLGIPFQNGPISGKDVFIPLDYVIGGPKQIGNGWRMLMECLAIGRAISLPSSTIGCAKVGALVTGSYARIREQFKRPIADFEGIQEGLSTMLAHLYTADATRLYTAHAIDCGEKPAIAGAISKYQVTEKCRQIGQLAMDIQAGKAVMMGPNNIVARSYQGASIAITVEGANILTRNLIVFGQGLMRSHPYLLSELNAVRSNDVRAFDVLLISHIRDVCRSGIRAFLGTLRLPDFSPVLLHPLDPQIKALHHASNSLSFFINIVLGVYGGKLKFKEFVSARMGDAVSEIYMALCVLKKFEDDGRPTEDLPVVQLCILECLQTFWKQIDASLYNFPVRILAWKARVIMGARKISIPDSLRTQVAQKLSTQSGTRTRLMRGLWNARSHENPVALYEDAMHSMIQIEPILKRVKAPRMWHNHIAEFEVSDLERALLEKAKNLLLHIIAVDDFKQLPAEQ